MWPFPFLLHFSSPLTQHLVVWCYYESSTIGKINRSILPWMGTRYISLKPLAFNKCVHRKNLMKGWGNKQTNKRCCNNCLRGKRRAISSPSENAYSVYNRLQALPGAQSTWLFSLTPVSISCLFWSNGLSTS